MAKITNLQALLVNSLQDLYDVERQLVAALPRFAGAAHDELLASTLSKHSEETRAHVSRLQSGLTLLLAEPAQKRAAAMASMIGAADAGLRGFASPGLRDCSLIAHAQKIEHFEIASYTAALRLAEGLGYAELAELLKLTLEEEIAARDTLSTQARVLNSNPPRGARAAATRAEPADKPFLSRLRSLLPGRFGDDAPPARRPRKFDLSEESFLGSRSGKRRASRPSKSRKTKKPAGKSKAKRSPAQPRPSASPKRRAARRRKPRRTDE